MIPVTGDTLTAQLDYIERHLDALARALGAIYRTTP